MAGNSNVKNSNKLKPNYFHGVSDCGFSKSHKTLLLGPPKKLTKNAENKKQKTTTQKRKKRTKNRKEKQTKTNHKYINKQQDGKHAPITIPKEGP